MRKMRLQVTLLRTDREQKIFVKKRKQRARKCPFFCEFAHFLEVCFLRENETDLLQSKICLIFLIDFIFRAEIISKTRRDYI